MLKTFLIASLTLFIPCQALLPPLYHTLAEFKAVVENEQLVQKLQSGEAIVSIQRLEDGNFEVITTKHKIPVEVVFEKTKMIGPGKFHLVIHDPIPLN